MTDSCENHYLKLHETAGRIVADSFLSVRAESMARGHSFVGDLELWITEIRNRPEVSVLQSALREYQYSLMALSFGQYRAAFSALRLSLELSFSTALWSANERELREWQRGLRDSNWASLSDKETGVLSRQFVSLFSEGLADEAPQYRASAVAVYRECSEYVHGNAHTHRALPSQLIFDEPAFIGWHQKASVVRLTVSFVLAARYAGEFDGEAKSRMENSLLDQLGHSVGVRRLLGAPVEKTNG
jgi:hypothetical protein